MYPRDSVQWCIFNYRGLCNTVWAYRHILFYIQTVESQIFFIRIRTVSDDFTCQKTAIKTGLKWIDFSSKIGDKIVRFSPPGYCTSRYCADVHEIFSILTWNRGLKRWNLGRKFSPWFSITQCSCCVMLQLNILHWNIKQICSMYHIRMTHLFSPLSSVLHNIPAGS